MHAADKDLRGRVCVVIDTLRATSVMVTALSNGCEQIIPVEEVDQAMELRASMGARNTILGGERNAQKLVGFDYGNSPLEYTPQAVYGKTLVMTTSNGTRAIIKASAADAVYMGSMLNATAVAKAMMKQKKDIVILCAGTNGRFSIDDALTAGFIIDRMLEHRGKQTVALDDLGYVCHMLFDQNRDDIDACVGNAGHCCILKDLGLQDDIDYCMTPDSLDVLPRYEDGRITLYKKRG
jgi:2-phosphosulfolactate phosphatase